eukprot:TRINITY_DN11314_c0_g1_i1.p1 TRINITY_DN11314_c0_g1~~TRINITY_DN11314_c0_g1_i1.p1  ORF type:complete len:364 (+),score=107.76 TRINITY_DN11314_c0_g1_i1:45-1136(+)
MATFTTTKLGSHTIKNRLALAPMTRGRSTRDTAVPLPSKAEHYSTRTSLGLLISEGVFVNDSARGWLEAPGIYTEEQLEAWKPIVAAVKEADADVPFFAQLWHTGAASHKDLQNGKQPVSSSDIALPGESHTPTGKKPYEAPRPLTIEEIKQTVQDFKQAAINALEVGFDGVEIHAANGYLLNQFLEPKYNKRTDIYGGSKENNFRFLKEVIEALLEVLPSDKVGVRLSPNGAFNGMGSEGIDEYFRYYITELNQFNLGYFHVIDGLAFGFHNFGEPMTLAEIRELYNGFIVANCGYDSLEKVEQALETGADVVAIGRSTLSNPDLAERWQNGWELSEMIPYELFYFGDDEGYVNIPKYQQQS